MEHRRSFLILHGWQSHRPERHWQSWLARRLRALGHHVRYPQLPSPDHPAVDAWLGTYRRLLAEPTDGERVVICYSLSCMAWLHLAAAGAPRRPVDRLLFVAPPSPGYLAGQPAVAGFRAPAESWRRLPDTCLSRPQLVCSDNDPYCEGGAHQLYGPAFRTHPVLHDGHLDMPAGYGPWQPLLDWCLDPAAEIRGNRDPRGVHGRERRDEVWPVLAGSGPAAR